MNYFDLLYAGFALGFGAFCVVTGVGSGFRVVRWIAKKLDVVGRDDDI